MLILQANVFNLGLIVSLDFSVASI